MKIPSLDILILTKDNPSEFLVSLNSLPDLLDFISFNVIAFDGSIEASNRDLIKHYLRSSPFNYIYHDLCSLRVSGIYPSMNFALDHLGSDWCIFLNSGDYFVAGLPWDQLSSLMSTYDIVLVLLKL